MFSLPLNNEYLAILLLSIAIIILLVLVIRLEVRVRRLLRGKKASSLEDTIINLSNEIENLKTFKSESESYFKNVEKRLRRSVQGVKTLRFNAFHGEGIGGNQSFASAFMNENGDGVVLSSIYSRERVSIFSKPVKNFTSEFELSEEEVKAITLARESTENRNG